ncbi:MAG: Rieske 2Fe-2S domain-containing protein [Myxococcota bacterium]
MFVRNAWYIASWADDLRKEPLARRICDEPVVLYRDSANHAAALVDRCCHRGTPLSLGRVTHEGLECGYHGLVFGRDGACVRVPGQDRVPPSARVRSYPVVEKDGFVWIWMGDAQAADPAQIIDYPYHADRARWPHKHTFYPIAANYMLLVDNLMDLTHLGYVHGGTIGGNPATHVEAKMDTHPTPRGLKFTRWMLDSEPPPTYTKAVSFQGRVDRWQEFEYVAPGSIVQWSGATDAGTGAVEGKREGGFSLRLFHGVTPETETSCFYFWSAANGYRQDEPVATEQLFLEISRAFDQDKAVVEAQQARLLELGQEGLVNLKADAARVRMRQTVERLLAAERVPEA